MLPPQFLGSQLLEQPHVWAVASLCRPGRQRFSLADYLKTIIKYEVSVEEREKTLAELAKGQGGRIRRVAGGRHLRRRLMELGMLPGTWVEVRRVAPLGDPVELRVRNYSLSIRRNEAVQVVMSPEKEAGAQGERVEPQEDKG